MAELRIREASGPEDIAALLALPHRLHAQDPSWVAPLGVLEARRLRPSNPFFKEARLSIFLATRGSDVVGSISVLQDRGFQAHHGDRVLWFGWFECEPDPEVATALLQRAIETARAWGGTVLRGPRNLTRFEYMGLTVGGHDRRPPMLQGHHPSYYQELIEGAGFTKHHDIIAYEADLYDAEGAPTPLPDNLRLKSEACSIPGLEVRRARWRSMGHDLRAAHAVLNESYKTVPDVSPMPQSTFVSVGRGYLTVANTEMMQLATVNGRPSAFAVCLPEINEALHPMRGSLLPLGWLRGARALRGVRTAAFKLIGVVPDLRHTGLHARLIQHVVNGARRAGYTRIDGSVIDERNKPMRGVVEGAGMTEWRRYRLYDFVLGEPSTIEG